MKCPKCGSDRIQYDEKSTGFERLAGMRKVHCRKCKHNFRSFDPLGKLARSKGDFRNNRLSPRYAIHLPTEISLVETSSERGKATYSEPSRGHCEAINKFGMGLSLVGSRFPEEELTRIGRLLFVRVHLPEATLETVVTVVNHHRIGEDKKRKWFLGVKIHQISEVNHAYLLSYLEERSRAQPLAVSEE